jgi:methionine biosynthesis protein MetW
MNCPICNAFSNVSGNSLFDDRYGYPGKFPLVHCSNCGHIFLQAIFSAEQITALYSTYYPRSTFNVENHCPHQEKSGARAWFDGVRASAFRWVPRNVRVLDIGCGYGETLGYHQARGCEVYGVETDENIRPVAERYGYNVHVGLFDENIYEAESFDYVTMDQVFEHVQNPTEVLSGVARVLKPGGVAILSVPNAAGWGAKFFGNLWINWHAPYHLQFFSVNSMQIVASKAGFQLDKSITLTASDWLSYQWIHLLTHPKEGNPSEFWTQNGRYNLSQKFAIKILHIVHRCKVNHLITRIFDCLGLGDNRLFFLQKL